MVSALRGGLLRPDEILIVAHGPVGPAGLECGHRYARRPPKPAPPSTRGSPGRKRRAWARLPLLRTLPSPAIEVAAHLRGRGPTHRRRQLGLARPPNAPDGAEDGEQFASLRGPDAGDLVQLGADRPALARLPVEADGEAVCLVADTLDELQHRRAARQRDGLVPAAHEDQLLTLGEARHGLLPQPQLLERSDGGPELTLPPVDEHEIGQLAALLEDAPVAPADHLAHRGEVVGGPGDPAHAELTVVRLLRRSLLEEDHGRHDVG